MTISVHIARSLDRQNSWDFGDRAYVLLPVELAGDLAPERLWLIDGSLVHLRPDINAQRGQLAGLRDRSTYSI